MIRSAQMRCRLAWLTIIAMALVACAPTIMRLHATLGAEHGAHAHHHMAMEHGGNPSEPDDCWSKCGYCDFLTHTPAIDSVQYIPPFVALAGRDLFLRETALPPAHDAFDSAAQPRGPPALA